VVSTLLRTNRTQPCLEHPPYCIEGTEGELRVPRTILPKHVAFGTRRTTDLPENILDHYQQVIFEKRNLSILSNLRIERLLTQLSNKTTFILCGAGLAGGILQAAIALRSRKFSVIVVEDASANLGDPNSEMAVRRMVAKGVVFCQTSTIIAPPAAKNARASTKSGSSDNWQLDTSSGKGKTTRTTGKRQQREKRPALRRGR
jgi:nicotinamidase-related amidase